MNMVEVKRELELLQDNLNYWKKLKNVKSIFNIGYDTEDKHDVLYIEHGWDGFEEGILHEIYKERTRTAEAIYGIADRMGRSLDSLLRNTLWIDYLEELEEDSKL